MRIYIFSAHLMKTTMNGYQTMKTLVFLFVLLAEMAAAWAGEFLCAGFLSKGVESKEAKGAAKFALARIEGTLNTVIIFACLHGEDRGWEQVPEWGKDIFDPELPGSFSHFYDAMSFGKLRVRGEVAPRVYESSQPASAYVADSSTDFGDFGSFALDILRQADGDIDFSRFDNDGPDGVPNSGDDDGWVDAVFLVLAGVPQNFLLGGATGMGDLGFDENFVTDDAGAVGEPIRISGRLGTVQQGRTFVECVGSMAHEYGHVLGLPDLYNVDFLLQKNAAPAEDSAGIGAWGLMGWGALGWSGNDGPTSFSAWSRMQLGWVEVEEPTRASTELALEDVGIGGSVFKVPLASEEYFLLEYRRRTSSFYDRQLPGEGILIWHVARDEVSDRVMVDLECADGRWADAGYPLGGQANPDEGGDNLDFWAHDAEYTRQHQGNLGDGADPFEGARFDSFTPETNPAAYSHDGQRSVRIEEIDLDGDRASARISVVPAAVELDDLFHTDSQRDDVVLAGEAVTISFELINAGGFRLADLTTRLFTEDPEIEILDPEIEMKDLEVGAQARISWLSKEGLPQIRVARSSAEYHSGTVTLEIYAGDDLLAKRELDITARKSQLLSGRITDEAGEGVGGIGIFLAGGRIYSTEVSSEEDGSFQVYLLPGVYSAIVNSQKEKGFASRRLKDISMTQDRSLAIDLPTAHRVYGVVRDTEGNPVKGAQVGGDGENGTYDGTYTLEDGSYELELPQGIFAVQVYLNEFTPPFLPSANFPPFEVEGVVVEGETRLDLDWPSSVRLSVEVVDEEGTALGDAQVALRRDGFPSQSIRTDAQGRGALRILPGVAYQVHLSSLPLSVLEPDDIPIQAASDTTVQLVLEKGIPVTVSLIDEEGASVDTGYLTVRRPGELVSYGGGIRDGRWSAVLEPGEYLFTIIFFTPHPFCPTQELEVVEVRDEMEIELVVKRGQVIDGKVEDDFEEYLTSGQLAFYPLEGGFPSVNPIDSDGSFQTVLFPASYRAYYQPPWNVASTHPYQLLDSLLFIEGDGSRDFVVRRGTPVEGRLLGVGKSDYTGIMLGASGIDDRTAASTPLDADGSFQIWLLPGRHLLNLSGMSPDFGTSWSGGEIEVPSESFVLLDFSTVSTFSGRITDSLGNPRETKLLFTYASDDPAAVFKSGQRNFAAYLSSMADGSYEVEVRPGRYDFIAFDQVPPGWGWGRVWRDIDLSENGERDFVFPEPEVTYRVEGSVWDAKGEPLPSSEIQFLDPRNGNIGWTWTSGGRYEADLPPGSYRVVLARYNPLGGYYGETHYVGVVQVAGETEWDIRLPSVETAIEEVIESRPILFALHPNYPNPFNAGTAIPYQLPRAERVRLAIYGILGQRVRVLVDEMQSSGKHQAVWNGTGDSGKRVGNGVYFYRLSTDTREQVRRMILIK